MNTVFFTSTYLTWNGLCFRILAGYEWLDGWIKDTWIKGLLDGQINDG